MSTITIPQSIFFEGQWFDAHWLAEVVDDTTGELVITATTTTQPVIIALRMTTDLVRQLRTVAGFDAPLPVDQARAALAYWRASVQWCVDTFMNLEQSNGNARLALEGAEEYLIQLLKADAPVDHALVMDDTAASRSTWGAAQWTEAVDRLLNRIDTLEERLAVMEAATQVDAIEVADAAVYDEFHVEWERDEWKARVETYRSSMSAVVALEEVDPDGLRWTWKELFTVAQQIARAALDR